MTMITEEFENEPTESDNESETESENDTEVTDSDDFEDEEDAKEAEAAAAAKPGEIVGFEDLGLSEEALKLIRAAGYLVPTPIQEQAIPAILDGYDVIGSAQTGTGKTATFTLPVVEQLAGRGGTLAIVLSPTREIAQQTFDAFETFGKPRGVRAVVLIGGVPMNPQLEALKTYPQVIVATPGRLVDHMERGTVWLDYVEIVVLDEADRMLDMGFMPQISRIMAEVPKDRQTLLFSATIPPPIEKLTRTMMYEPVRIAVGKPLAAASSVHQELVLCDPNRKMSELRRILKEEAGTIIVFSRSKKGVVELWQSLHSAGVYDATMLHSDRTQEQRSMALADFKAGKYRILIATDVAARGIDVANVAHVVNFDVPFVPEDYIHRIGRSGRASATGKATTLCTIKDKRLLHDIEKMLGKPIPVTRDATSADGGRDDSRGSSRGGDRDRGRGGGGGGRGGPDRGRSGGGGAGGRSGGSDRPRSEGFDRDRSGGATGTAQPRIPATGPSPVKALTTPIPVTPYVPRELREPREPNLDGPVIAASAGGPVQGQVHDAGEGAEGDGGPKKRKRRRGGRGRRRTGGEGEGGTPTDGGAPAGGSGSAGGSTPAAE